MKKFLLKLRVFLVGVLLFPIIETYGVSSPLADQGCQAGTLSATLNQPSDDDGRNLWGWMLGGLVGAGALGYGLYRYQQSKLKPQEQEPIAPQDQQIKSPADIQEEQTNSLDQLQREAEQQQEVLKQAQILLGDTLLNEEDLADTLAQQQKIQAEMRKIKNRVPQLARELAQVANQFVGNAFNQFQREKQTERIQALMRQNNQQINSINNKLNALQAYLRQQQELNEIINRTQALSTIQSQVRKQQVPSRAQDTKSVNRAQSIIRQQQEPQEITDHTQALSTIQSQARQQRAQQIVPGTHAVSRLQSIIRKQQMPQESAQDSQLIGDLQAAIRGRLEWKNKLNKIYQSLNKLAVIINSIENRIFNKTGAHISNEELNILSAEASIIANSLKTFRSNTDDVRALWHQGKITSHAQEYYEDLMQKIENKLALLQAQFNPIYFKIFRISKARNRDLEHRIETIEELKDRNPY